MTRITIAVVIPVLNEVDRVKALLEEVKAQGFEEVIVADGGSGDGTVEAVLAQSGTRLVRSERGRARQMNVGAAAASPADVLLFLHADTRLPPEAARLVADLMQDSRVVGGSFRLTFDRRHPLLDVYAACSRFDTAWTTFGDQAFFIRRAQFDALGGFPDQPVLEDMAMRKALRRRGRFVKLGASVETSARRFEAEGLLRRQLKNGFMLALHAGGVSPHRLAALYR